MIKVDKIRADFPIYQDQPNLVYLDSTATSLKPEAVIEKLNEYYCQYSANVLRGIYPISERATEEMETAREKIAGFLGIKNSAEIIFVRNPTEAINLVAYSWGIPSLQAKEEVWSTQMEHHANLVPGQQLAIKHGWQIRDLPFDKKTGQLLWQTFFQQHTQAKVRLLALTHISNVLGTINPISQIVKEFKKQHPEALVLVDGAQAVPHVPVDLPQLGVDF